MQRNLLHRSQWLDGKVEIHDDACSGRAVSGGKNHLDIFRLLAQPATEKNKYV